MKPKISNFYRLAIYFPSRLKVKKVKDNKYWVQVKVSEFINDIYYEFSPEDIKYVGSKIKR